MKTTTQLRIIQTTYHLTLTLLTTGAAHTFLREWHLGHNDHGDPVTTTRSLFLLCTGAAFAVAAVFWLYRATLGTREGPTRATESQTRPPRHPCE